MRNQVILFGLVKKGSFIEFVSFFLSEPDFLKYTTAYCTTLLFYLYIFASSITKSYDIQTLYTFCISIAWSHYKRYQLQMMIWRSDTLQTLFSVQKVHKFTFRLSLTSLWIFLMASAGLHSIPWRWNLIVDVHSVQRTGHSPLVHKFLAFFHITFSYFKYYSSFV